MPRKPVIFIPKTPPRCCGKNSYPTRHEAQRVADEQMTIDTNLRLAVYACLCGCGGWHLTRGSGDPSRSED